MKKIILAITMVIGFASIVNAKVIEINVVTGESTERDYTQAELDDIATRTASPKRIKQANRRDAIVKRKAAIEAILMASKITEAKAYKTAKAKLSP